MDKILTFQGKTDRGIFTYVIDAERNYLEKTAAEYHPTIASYINDAKPIKGKTQVLITALGAGEYWGDNVNGDYFPETALAHPGTDYGYETFKHYAKVFKHHINKPSSPSYGEVLLSVYNPVYHRVELVVTIDHALAPDIISRVESGDYPDWSMGCVKATAKVLKSDYQLVDISTLKTGDEIITGTGEVASVSYPHSHAHKGTWFTVSVQGVHEDDEVTTTEEHPWLTLPKEQVKCHGNPNNKSRCINLCLPNRALKKGCCGCPNAADSYKPKWIRADDLCAGDYVGTPILKGEGPAPEDRFAYLAGLYLAQGSYSKDDYITLHVNSEQEFLTEKLRSLYPEINFTWRLEATSKGASIFIARKELARKIVALIGTGAHTKLLSMDIMYWPIESQKIFLGGYLDGDGGVYKSSCYFSTCNRPLANQIKAVLLRCGVISSVNKIYHKPSTIVKIDTIEYQVWAGQTSSQALKDYSYKTRGLVEAKMCKETRFISGGYLWSPITGISTVDCDEDVYNIAIDTGDYNKDSYQIGNIALHNCKVPFDICSICGNKAPTRKQYCHHARYLLGKIDPDTGKKVYVINTMPKFFDISLVLIGADRIAKTLKKVAYTTGYRNLPILSSAYLAEKEAEQKRAEMEKEVPTNEPPASQDNIEKVKDLAKTITEVKAMEPAIPPRVLDGLVGEHPLAKILSTMTMMGIVPKPQEFQRIFLISNGQSELAKSLADKNMCFDPMSVEEPPREAVKQLDLGAHNFDNSILKILAPFMADRSYLAPHLGKRIVIMIKSGAEQPLPILIKVSAEDVKKDRKPFSPALALLVAAGAYAALTHNAPKEALLGIDKVLSTPEGIGLAAILGLGLVSSFNKVVKPGTIGQGSSPGSRVNPDVNDVFSRIQELKQKPFSKVGMQKSAIAKRLILGPSAAYMASGVLQKQRELRPYDEDGRIKSFIRQYPDAISAAFAADAVLSTRGTGTKQLIAGLKGFAKAAAVVDELYGTDLVKTADAQDFLEQGILWPIAFGTANLPGRVVGGLFDQAVLESGKKLLKKKQEKELAAISQKQTSGRHN